jgi:uncharacterized OsmC-like protein
MVPARLNAREFTYAIALDRAGIVTAGGEAPLDLEPAWTPEHLTLAGLVRCTLESLRYHADRIGVDYLASATADAQVTKREEDGPLRVRRHRRPHRARARTRAGRPT